MRWCTLPPGRLGGPDAGGTKGALFVLCRQNGGSCCCLGPSAHPRVRLYRIPQLSTTSLPSPLPQSLANTCPSIHPHLPHQLGGVQRFVDAQESEQTSSRRKTGLLLCQLPGKALFIATKKIPVSECVCVNNCMGIGLG